MSHYFFSVSSNKTWQYAWYPRYVPLLYGKYIFLDPNNNIRDMENIWTYPYTWWFIAVWLEIARYAAFLCRGHAVCWFKVVWDIANSFKTQIMSRYFVRPQMHLTARNPLWDCSAPDSFQQFPPRRVLCVINFRYDTWFFVSHFILLSIPHNLILFSTLGWKF